jgi:hypothetical protein
MMLDRLCGSKLHHDHPFTLLVISYAKGNKRSMFFTSSDRKTPCFQIKCTLKSWTAQHEQTLLFSLFSKNCNCYMLVQLLIEDIYGFKVVSISSKKNIEKYIIREDLMHIYTMCLPTPSTNSRRRKTGSLRTRGVRVVIHTLGR